MIKKRFFKKKISSYAWGHFVEKYVAFCLFFKGYKVLERNYKPKSGTGQGEVDLILKKGKTLIFVEVKYRKTLSSSKEAIFQKSLLRLSKTAKVVAAKHPSFDFRVDAVCVHHFFLFEHVKNITM